MSETVVVLDPAPTPGVVVIPTPSAPSATVQVASTGAVTDHSALTGLLDDDHPQYALADGSRGSFHPPDATIVSKGIIQLSGDLAGTAGAPKVPDLALLNDMADLTIQFENGLV